MLFNSVFFITIFIPLCLAGYFILQKFKNPVYGKIFLVGMSLWFYGFYNLYYLGILIISMAMNYIFSIILGRVQKINQRKLLLSISVGTNLGLLFYFKYFNFFIDNCNYLLHTSISVEKIALPLGISFFTFQQISYIVDLYWKKASCYRWWDYACYVTFFPQLIAGPIVHHSDFVPQLLERKNRRISAENLFDGVSLFILGLSKKVLLADNLAILVNAEYGNIAYLDSPSAWVTIICFTLELYFDFSGYCDMARGLGKMFGFTLPKNFNAPLKATSVKEFWRRWHITLSQFFTNYIYIPLGGSRKGTFRKYLNLMIVFTLSGLWHGANWTFIVWGVLNGVVVVWESLFPNFRFRQNWLNRTITFIFTVLSCSIFRSDSLEQALLLWKKLFFGGNNGMLWGICNVLKIPENYVLLQAAKMLQPAALNLVYLSTLVIFLGISVWVLREEEAEAWIEKKGRSTSGLLLLSILFIWSFLSLSQVSTYLYFDF